jgi:hypothetical protein
MTPVSASLVATPLSLDTDDESTSQGVVIVHTCSRLGRRANPPSRWFSGWFRSRRR